MLISLVGGGELDILVLNAEGVSDWGDTMKNMVWDSGLRLRMSHDESAQSKERTSSTSESRR
ncbi:hypothetical protein D3I60_03225 [Brevibacterium permense]|nr:hypothetical protein [Brevibacterium permense]